MLKYILVLRSWDLLEWISFLCKLVGNWGKRNNIPWGSLKLIFLCCFILIFLVKPAYKTRDMFFLNACAPWKEVEVNIRIPCVCVCTPFGAISRCYAHTICVCVYKPFGAISTCCTYTIWNNLNLYRSGRHGNFKWRV